MVREMDGFQHESWKTGEKKMPECRESKMSISSCLQSSSFSKRQTAWGYALAILRFYLSGKIKPFVYDINIISLPDWLCQSIEIVKRQTAEPDKEVVLARRRRVFLQR